MTTFSRPSAVDQSSETDFSPDGRYMIVVTSRGLLENNEVQSTIWLLNAEADRRFVEGNDSSPNKEALPKAIASVSAVPDISTFDTYAPVITNLQWSRDSKGLYFLGMDSHEERRLYQVDVRSGAVQPLTPAGWGVRQYSVSSSVVAYTAERRSDSNPEVPWNDTEAINRDAGAVTGLGLEAVLYPAGGQGTGSGRYVPDLWVGSPGKFHHVPNVDGAKPARDAEHYLNALSLSPDHRKVVRLLPITEVDGSWSTYDPKPGFESWRIDPKQMYQTSPTYSWRLREYALVDTTTGIREPLIRAPHGSSLAEEDATLAVWSRDGRRVLVGNVALPLNGADAKAQKRREHTCALAAVDVPSLKTHCVAFTRDASAVISPDNPHPLRLQQASFGPSNDDVIASFAWHGQGGQTERYHFDGEQWSLAQTIPGDPITGAPLDIPDGNPKAKKPAIHLDIRQDLNTPPTLWASLAGKSKQLWNPSPQIAAMKLGKASLYHWKDRNSYEWEGVLVLPADYEPRKRYPLVIQTHGYRPGVFVTDGLYPTAMAARPLSSAGFVVLQTGNRADHFVSPQEASDAIDEWESAISQLDREGMIEKQRVGIIGFSRTCWYVEQALIEHPQMFSAATLADGLDESYMTYRLFAEGRPSMAKEYEKIIGASPAGSGLSRWIRSAPGFHLDRVETPVRIEAIGPVSVLTEWEIYASLREEHKPVDMIYFPAGQHILQKPLDRMASQQGNVDWFRFWLESYQDPDPAKVAQYDRWTTMRNAARKAAGHE
jgi:dipeptidyl aminopeptidase/acylaminoacyl peptidase